MKITALNKDKKHLIKVCFDDGTDCMLDRDVCADASLNTDTDLSDEELQSLKYESDYRRAKSRALWYLDRMDYTEKALYTKLLQAGFGKTACAEVLARLTELGVVDDRRFAERFCERAMENNISKREALHKMLQKGVPYDMAKLVLEESDADEDAQLDELIAKKYAARLSSPEGVQKVYAALVRKGFSYSAIKSALKRQVEFSEDFY